MIFNNTMYRRHFFIFASIFFIFLLPFFAGCENRIKKLPTQNLTIQKADNSSVALIAEIADTTEERSQGLMYRQELAAGEGMLFVFDHDQVIGFWMKNTFIPLSIAFISSDGIILEIRDMKPQSEASVVSSRSVRYALEVPQGWFAAEGIETGDKLIKEQ
jgi:uncharacterized membrane protein (UPF0127 family)